MENALKKIIQLFIIFMIIALAGSFLFFFYIYHPEEIAFDINEIKKVEVIVYENHVYSDDIEIYYGLDADTNEHEELMELMIENINECHYALLSSDALENADTSIYITNQDGTVTGAIIYEDLISFDLGNTWFTVVDLEKNINKMELLDLTNVVNVYE
jgi:hypothetical protein